MEEAARLCDRLIILDKSHIIARGTPAELIRRYVGEQVVEVRLDYERREQSLAAARRAAAGYELEETDDVLFVYNHDGHDVARFDAGTLVSEAEEVLQRRATLEDVFLRLTGRGLIE